MCREDLEAKGEEVLRTYHTCSVLARMKQLIPLELYANKDPVGKVREDLATLRPAVMLDNLGKQQYLDSLN